MAEKLNITHADMVFKVHGIMLLEKEYTNSRTKMASSCLVCDYEWSVCLDKVRDRRGCPRCSKCLKYTIIDAQNVAKEHCGECVSTIFKDVHSKLTWKCSLGHKWDATFHHVQGGTWCPDCSWSKPKTIEICCDMAAENDGYCLSTVYGNAFSPLTWKCANEHIWNTSYVSVYKGSWCPECSSLKSQKALIDFIRLIFPHYTVFFNFRGFVWLETIKKHRQVIDIYILELKLAIEYDGEQHFRPVRFCGISQERAEENFKNVQRLDALKEGKIKQHREDVTHLVRFNYADDLTLELVRQRLIDNGVLVNDQKTP